MKREAAVTKEMTTKMADDKKLSKQEKDERILWKKNEVGSYSILYLTNFHFTNRTK